MTTICFLNIIIMMQDINISGDKSFKDFGDLFFRYAKEQNTERLFIVCDSNTKLKCLSLIISHLPHSLKKFTMTIKPEERSKEMSTVMDIVSFITDNRGDKRSVVLNLGGGVVSDTGGFAAGIFKRGISCINVPTTLLAQIDAAIGGKTGVNFGNIKNHVGMMHYPDWVYINPAFLKTLPDMQFRSGLGEIFKYSMINSGFTKEDLMRMDIRAEDDLLYYIEKCVKRKMVITTEDPLETGIRKLLNFGHTVGHGIESLSLEKGLDITHGEAVAAGVVAESFISHRMHSYPRQQLEMAARFFRNNFLPYLPKEVLFHTGRVIEYIVHDKKNKPDRINPVLLDSNGEPVLSTDVPQGMITESLEYLGSLNESQYG